LSTTRDPRIRPKKAPAEGGSDFFARRRPNQLAEHARLRASSPLEERISSAAGPRTRCAPAPERPQSFRVLRGGSWNNHPHNLRSANRNRNQPDNRNNNVGFRVASTLCAGAFGITVPRVCIESVQGRS